MSYKNNKIWRKRRPKIWQKQKKRYHKQFVAGAFNGRQKYTTREDNMILNKKYLDRVIAKKIGRTVRAIQIRRTRLRKAIQIATSGNLY